MSMKKAKNDKLCNKGDQLDDDSDGDEDEQEEHAQENNENGASCDRGHITGRKIASARRSLYDNTST